MLHTLIIDLKRRLKIDLHRTLIFLNDSVYVKCLHVKKLLGEDIKNKKGLDVFVLLTTSEDDNVFGHFLLLVRSRKIIFFYDSFGMNPSVYSKIILTFLLRHNYHKKMKWNRQIQSFDSITCGGHILHILYFISQCNDIQLGVKLYKNSLSSNLLANDKNVVRFLYSNFEMTKPL